MSEHLTYDTPAAAAHLTFNAAPAPAEVAAGADARPTLTGYAIVWGATSSTRYDAKGNPRRDRMLPGSAKYDAAAEPVQALYSHDRQQVLGTTANGSLSLTPDQTGLKFAVRLPDTAYARDVAALVRDGYVTGCSFGMDPIAWNDRAEAGGTVREYSAYRLSEVTITGSPAFDKATVGHGPTPPTPARNDQSVRLQKNRLAGLAL